MEIYLRNLTGWTKSPFYKVPLPLEHIRYYIIENRIKHLYIFKQKIFCEKIMFLR